MYHSASPGYFLYSKSAFIASFKHILFYIMRIQKVFVHRGVFQQPISSWPTGKCIHPTENHQIVKSMNNFFSGCHVLPCHTHFVIMRSLNHLSSEWCHQPRFYVNAMLNNVGALKLVSKINLQKGFRCCEYWKKSILCSLSKPVLYLLYSLITFE